MLGPGSALGCWEKTTHVCPLTIKDIITGKMDEIQHTGNISLSGCSSVFQADPAECFGLNSWPGFGDGGSWRWLFLKWYTV